MGAFDRVIGYESIKKELMQISDMICNREKYDDLGAKIPSGVILYGDPGLGKTLMANAFIEESGLKSFAVRRTSGDNDFLNEITEVFRKAKAESPSIVFLDDIDKFANEDFFHTDTEEYVAVQAGIDSVKDSSVFVIATANEVQKLPASILRPGRFDRKIMFQSPSEQDAEKIIEYYLRGKKVSPDVDMDDLVGMIQYRSCAELESILNDAAIYAGAACRTCIEMEDLVKAVLRTQYDSPDSTEISEEKLRRSALHEAGHLVVCETLAPGSVGFVSLRSAGRCGVKGFMHLRRDLEKLLDRVIVSLASKAAIELYYPESCDGGCSADISKAYHLLLEGVAENGMFGFALVSADTRYACGVSDCLATRREITVQSELEQCLNNARRILLMHRKFLERTAEALLQQETLLYSDIQKIRTNSETS